MTLCLFNCFVSVGEKKTFSSTLVGSVTGGACELNEERQINKRKKACNFY